MTIKRCYLVRDAVQFGTHLPVSREKLCPAPSASLTAVEVTDMWQRCKGCEIASGKGTVCPIRLLPAPVPLLPSTSTDISACEYSSTMKKEAMSSFKTLISISQTTRRHTPKTIFLNSEKKL